MAGTMSDFTPSTPIALQIRRIIFERFNDVDARFTNDEIFDILRSGGDIDPDWIVDDTEPFINELCDLGLARNIAQNFTTIWLKLFDTVEQVHCDGCGNDVCLGASEERRSCPNPSCGSAL